MTHDHFDDGLVHPHGWASTHYPNRGPNRENPAPVADAKAARTPSTVHHDDHLVHG